MGWPDRYFTSFVGRRALLNDVRQRLLSPDVVCLVGPGGVGKTRVARRITDDAKRSFPDGMWFCDVSEVGREALITSAVLDALGLVAGPQSDPASALLDFLANRRALLVLDGCEQHRAACAQLVERLRAGAPELRFLVTSRQPLGLSGETIVPVSPLTVPETGSRTPPEALGQYEAIELFVERATAASVQFRLTSENADAVARLCTALEGIPLAIELAAARARVLTPQAMLDNLIDRYSLLDHGYRDAVDRHRSLRACVAWSFDLCSPAEQAVWSRLSVFRGGAEFDAVAAVCTDETVAKGELLALLSSLADQSVLEVNSTRGGAVRYKMLDYIADYGREKLAEEPSELRRWCERHLDWCIALAEQFESSWVGARQAEVLGRLRGEEANIEAALAFCSGDAELAENGLRLAVKLDQFWLASALYSHGRHWLSIAEDPGSGDPVSRATALALAARFAYYEQDEAAGRTQIEQVRSILAQHPNDRAEGLVTLAAAFGMTARENEPGTSAAKAREAAELLRTSGSRADELLALSLLGVLLSNAGDRQGAAEAYEECIRVAEQTGETYRRSFSLTGLAEQALGDGDLARAGTLFSQALRMKVELDDTLGIVVALESLGRVAAGQQDWVRAATLLGASEGVRDTLGIGETNSPFAIPSARFEAAQQIRARLGTKAFRTAFRDGAGLGPPDAVAYALRETDTPRTPVTEPSPLTKREAEVAELVGEGLSNPEIATRLFISVRTAQGHVENILRKLGFTSRSMIAAWIVERRVSTAPPPALRAH